MANPQLHPLQVNPHTGEPFLRLKNHKHIIITPPRPSDRSSFISILNDHRVNDWFLTLPYPYLPEHAEAWYMSTKVSSDAILDELEAAKNAEGLITVGGCPVRAIREVKDDGSDIFLGDIGIQRCPYGELMAPGGLDWEQKAHYNEVNFSRPIGDPDIIWTIGDYLVPSHHKQGIMTDAVTTVLQEWAAPRMGAQRLLVAAFKGNEPSMRVFQKCGFILTRTLEEYVEAKGKQGLYVLEWNSTPT